MMKKIVFLLSLFLSLSAEAKLLNVTYFKLNNGLEVAVVENHKAPVVLHRLYYKTGSVNDPQGKGGIAHLLEHLMFRGTKKVPDQDFNRLTDVHGATNNAYTNYHETAYYEFSDISKLELMMALEADRMKNLKISDEAFDKERKIVLQERYQRYETQPTPLFYEMLRKMLWQEHPYARPVSGSVAEIKSLKKEDAIEFYKKWYRPDNALLVLSGDLTATEAKVLAHKYYGAIVPTKPFVVEEKAITQRNMNAVIQMELDNVEHPRLVTFIQLDKESLTHKDVSALNLLAEYLCGDDTAFLYDKLVYKAKKFLSLDMDVSYDDKMGGTISFYAVPVNNTLKAEDMKKVIFDGISEGMKQLSQEKIEKIKNQILSDTVYLLENPDSTVHFVGTMLLGGYSVEEIEQYDENLQAISLEDIQQAWKIVEKSDVRLTGYLKVKERQ